MKKNILITGANGTLGKLLIKSLDQNKFNIIALSSKKIPKNNEIYSNVVCFDLEEFYCGKINFLAIDIVLHLAFSRTQNGYDLIDSIDFSRELFNKSKLANIQSVIHISSQSVYGNCRLTPSLESDRLNPFDFYGIAKYACEQLCEAIFQESNTKVIHIRLASLVSPFLKDRIINKMINCAIENNQITVVGGKQIFSFLDTRDAVDAINILLSKDLCKVKKIYNIGCDGSYTIMDIVETVKKVVSQDIKIKCIQSDIQTSIKLNSTSFYKDFDWYPKYSLEETIRWIYNNGK